MTEQVSAFLEKSIVCPVCSKESRQQKLKNRLCSSAEQESDQHVIRWNWTDPQYEGIKPQFYVLLHCPSCSYTDMIADYENPSGDIKFGGIKKLFESLKGPDKEFLKKLTPLIAVHPMTFESAMNAHLANIYIQELPQEKEYKNLVKLGRLYLRAAWLWRERAPQSKAVQASGVLADIERLTTETEKPLTNTEERIERLQTMLVRRVKSLNLSPDEEKSHPYQKVLGGLERSVGEIHQALGRLREFMQQDASGTLVSSAKGDSEYVGHPSYFEFLMAMTKYWPKLPLNERDCLKEAVRYFTEAYFTELNFDEVERVMTTNALIVDLHLRLEDYDSALQAIASVYKAGMDGKMTLQKSLREKKKDGKLSEKDEMQVESQISRIDYVLQKTAERRHEVKDSKVKSMMPRIQPILDENKGKAIEDIETILTDAGIPEDIVEVLEENGTLGGGQPNGKAKADTNTESSGKRGGLFGIFAKAG